LNASTMQVQFSGRTFTGEPVVKIDVTAAGGWLFTGLKCGDRVYHAATDGSVMDAKYSCENWKPYDGADFEPFRAFLKWPNTPARSRRKRQTPKV
jgi:hypothetical protein